MGKLRNNEQGFSVVEIVLVLVIVGLLGAVGWFVYDRNHNKTAPTTTTTTPVASTTPTTTPKPTPATSTKTFTSKDKVFSLEYPSNWVTDNKGSDIDSVQALDLFPNAASKTSFINDIFILEIKSKLSAKEWTSQVIGPVSEDIVKTNDMSINGYQTHYTLVKNESYTDNYYVLAHGGYLVYVAFREHETHFDTNQKVDSQTDNAKYLPQFNEVINSIKFL